MGDRSGNDDAASRSWPRDVAQAVARCEAH